MFIVTDKRCLVQPGKKFGRITVLGVPFHAGKGLKVHFVGQCECGTVKLFDANHVTGGRSRSCGCLSSEVTTKKNLTHGQTRTRLYRVWEAMKYRCGSEHCTRFDDYGGRGIAVCDEWRDSFEAFRDWAFASGYTDDLTIDRIDVNGNYEPDNCRWVDMVTQMRNTRRAKYVTAFGETKELNGWADDNRCVVNFETLKARIFRYGWGAERAMVTPPHAAKRYA